MNWKMKLLGSTIVDQIRTRAAAPILQIGSDKFRRSDLSRLDCYSFQAATTLSTKLKFFDVKDTRDLFERIHPNELAIPGLGKWALVVLGAAFQAKGIGGARPLDAWDERHDDRNVTWETVKRQEQVLRKAEKRGHVLRHNSRRNQAHELRVERFTNRQMTA